MRTLLVFILSFFICQSIFSQNYDYSFIKAFGTRGSSPGQFNKPIGVAFKQNLLYVADQDNHRIQVFDPNGIYVREISVADIPSSAGLLDVVIDSENNLLVGCVGGVGVLKLDSNGNLVQTINTEQAQGGSILAAQGVALDSKDNLYVADLSKARIAIFDINGEYLREIKVGYHIGDVAVDDENNLYATNIDNEYGAVTKYDASGKLLWELRSYNEITLSSPVGIKFSPSTNLIYVCDLTNNRILILDKSGRVQSEFSLISRAGFGQPAPMFVDIDEVNKHIYISNADNEIQIWGYSILSSAGESETGIQVHVYPNPGSGIIHIKTSSNLLADITIHDTKGNVILQKSALINQTATIDINSQTSGLYLVSIKAEGVNFSQRILKF